MRRASANVQSVLEPVVSGLGYEYVGAEYGQGENGLTLRVFIDTQAEQGILIDDCVAVSHQLSAVLDVEDVMTAAYQLEVSSPGVDRPLFKAAHFEAQIGEVIKMKLLSGVDGRRNFKGRLREVVDDMAIVHIDGSDFEVPLNDVEQAYLVADWAALQKARQKQ